jgi:hypothetical protein
MCDILLLQHRRGCSRNQRTLARTISRWVEYRLPIFRFYIDFFTLFIYRVSGESAFAAFYGAQGPVKSMNVSVCPTGFSAAMKETAGCLLPGFSGSGRRGG